MIVRLLSVLLLLLVAACDDETAGDGGVADAMASCGVLPAGETSCGAVTCPSECDDPLKCNKFCGGGDCLTCTAGGTFQRLVYDCIGMVCGATIDAGTVDR